MILHWVDVHNPLERRSENAVNILYAIFQQAIRCSWALASVSSECEFRGFSKHCIDPLMRWRESGAHFYAARAFRCQIIWKKSQKLNWKLSNTLNCPLYQIFTRFDRCQNTYSCFLNTYRVSRISYLSYVCVRLQRIIIRLMNNSYSVQVLNLAISLKRILFVRTETLGELNRP